MSERLINGDLFQDKEKVNVKRWKRSPKCASVVRHTFSLKWEMI